MHVFDDPLRQLAVTQSMLPRGVEIEVFRDHAEWMDRRNEKPWRINASEASALFGENTYLSAYALAQRKLGIELPPADDELVSKGRRWENFIADEAVHWLNQNAEVGTRYVRLHIPSTCRVTNVAYPALAATPDDLVALQVLGESVLGEAWKTAEILPLECKKVRWNLEYRWQDHAPSGYRIQNHVQMLCCGAEHGILAAMIGDEIRVTVQNLSPHSQSINMRAEAFLQNLHDGIMPELDGHDSTTASILKAFEGDIDEAPIPFPPEAEALISEMERAREERKRWEDAEEAAKNKIKAILGEHAAAIFSEGMVTWKVQGGNLTGLVVDPKCEGSLAAAGIQYERKVSARTRVLRIQRKRAK